MALRDDLYVKINVIDLCNSPETRPDNHLAFSEQHTFANN